jgi:hypothetical protein
MCCEGGARRRGGVAAPIVPGVTLVLLPKCPLCLAAWLGLVTGVGISAGAATYVCGAIIMLCVAGLALSIARVLLAARHQDRHSS